MILLALSCPRHQTVSHTLVGYEYMYMNEAYNKMYAYFPLLRFSWTVPGYHWPSFHLANTRSSAHCNDPSWGVNWPSCGISWPILELLLPSCVTAGLLSSGLLTLPCEFVGVSELLSLLLLLVVLHLLLDDDVWGTCFSEVILQSNYYCMNKLVITFGVLLALNEELIDVSWKGTVFGGYEVIYLTSLVSSITGSCSSCKIKSKIFHYILVTCARSGLWCGTTKLLKFISGMDRLLKCQS